ncbi:hypothetical protein SMA75_20255 [Escherichia coli]|uniref:hypothetical protein n=1 Tax=Escherichia coli TaxID=562 RepID=UPI003079070E
MLTELEVVNSCLATLGESPLNSIDPDHPFVPSAQAMLARAMVQEQGKGWWFNTDYMALQPDPVTKFVYFPNDAITVDTGGNAYVQRGRRMWNRATSTYEIGETVYIKVVRKIPFDELPELANQLVGDRAVMDFQHEFDGDAQKYAKLKDIYNQSFITIKAEEIRQQKANLGDSPTVQQKFAQFRPMSRYTNVHQGNGLGGVRNIGV